MNRQEIESAIEACKLEIEAAVTSMKQSSAGFGKIDRFLAARDARDYWSARMVYYRELLAR